jgi:hypothetical protein
MTEPVRIVMYTAAPKDFDGFGTKELSADAGRDNRGLVVRAVSIDTRDIDWQVSRYASGRHGYATATTAARFPSIWQIRDLAPAGTPPGDRERRSGRR